MGRIKLKNRSPIGVRRHFIPSVLSVVKFGNNDLKGPFKEFYKVCF